VYLTTLLPWPSQPEIGLQAAYVFSITALLIVNLKFSHQNTCFHNCTYLEEDAAVRVVHVFGQVEQQVVGSLAQGLGRGEFAMQVEVQVVCQGGVDVVSGLKFALALPDLVHCPFSLHLLKVPASQDGTQVLL